MAGNWPSESSELWHEVIKKSNPFQDAKDFVVWGTMLALAWALALSPLPKSAWAATLTHWIAWPQNPWNNLLQKVSISWNPYETPISIQQLPSWLQKDFRDLTAMVNNIWTMNQVVIEWGQFTWERRWIKSAFELWNVVYWAGSKEIIIRNFEQLSRIKFDDFKRDIISSLDWTKSTSEIKDSLIWRVLASTYSNNPEQLEKIFKLLWETWPNEINKWILDWKVFKNFQQLAIECISNLNSRWLLSEETLVLAIRTAYSIAYQEALKYKVWSNWEVLYDWDESSVKKIWLNMWRNAWMSWRALLATETSVRDLLMKPDSSVIVYRVTISSNWKKTPVYFMIPRDKIELWQQAIRYSIIWKERWQLSSLLDESNTRWWNNDQIREQIAKINQEWAEAQQKSAEYQQKTAESKRRTAESEQRTIIMEQFLQIVKWKPLEELRPQLATIIDLRNQYAKLPWYNPDILANYDDMIKKLSKKS